MTLFSGALMGINFATGFLDGVKQSNAYRQSAYDYRQQAAAFRRNAYLPDFPVRLMKMFRGLKIVRIFLKLLPRQQKSE